MMKCKLFNSPFEMGLRIIVLLAVAPKKRFSIDRIIGIDFISCYASDFGLPFPNLHGDNGYRYGEIVGRRLLVQESVKSLVTQGFIEVIVDGGYFFSISEKGEKFAKKLGTRYAKDYRAIAQAAMVKYKDNLDSGIIATIHSLAINTLRG